MLKKPLFALFASSLCVAACGGGDGDGGSGVDGTKALTTLSDEEIIEICEYSESLLGTEFEEVICYAQAISVSEGGSNCQEVADACIAEIEPEESDCATAPDDTLPSCASEVNVAEMESCLIAQANAFKSIDISCDTAPEEIEGLEPETPAECVAIEEKCPDLFGDSDSEPGDPV